MITLIIFSAVVFLPLPLMAASARKSGRSYKAIFDGIAGAALAVMLVFIVASATGNPIGQAISADLQEFCQAAANNTQIVSMLGMESVSFEERVSLLTQAYAYAINALPAVILAWTAVIAYFEYMLISKLSEKAKYPLPQLEKLKDFSMPRGALWGWILIYLMTLAVTFLGFLESNVLQINIQVLFQFAFQVQGIAAIFYFCAHKKWPKAAAIIASLLFLLTVIGQMVLCVIGFLDLGFGLRKAVTRR